MALTSSTNINASIAQVIKASTAKEVAEKLAERAEGELVEHTVTGPDDSPTIATTIALPADRLPAAVSSFIKKSVKVTFEEDWQLPGPTGSATAHLSATVGGVPVSFRGEEKLRQSQGTTTVDVSGDVVSSIPFLGGKIAKQAEPFVERILNARARALAENISG